MPKRKSDKSCEKDIDRYKSKIRKLEQKIRKRQTIDNESASEPEEAPVLNEEITEADTPALRPDDWLLQWPDDSISDHVNTVSEPLPGPSTAAIVPPEEYTSSENIDIELDTEVLKILGDDPSATEKYGPNIRDELANRLLYITKEGLTKENRKDLISKYPLPANCAQIDAPKINPEIKAAVPDSTIKRDKGIEIKQRQMSTAIAGLTEIINSQLNSKTKNNILLQKLLEICKILCDLQHGDSMTRRNFILFTLKNDMKEHLKNTKIDTFLFGENFAEVLKSARAVNKSGVELKADTGNKTANPRYKGVAPVSLNRKAPPPARKPPVGPAPLAPRSCELATLRAPYRPPLQTYHRPPHTQSSRMPLQAHHATHPGRRY